MTTPDPTPSVTPDPLVERLRVATKQRQRDAQDAPDAFAQSIALADVVWFTEAADHIEALTAENNGLRTAMKAQETRQAQTYGERDAATARAERYEKALRDIIPIAMTLMGGAHIVLIVYAALDRQPDGLPDR